MYTTNKHAVKSAQSCQLTQHLTTWRFNRGAWSIQPSSQNTTTCVLGCLNPCPTSTSPLVARLVTVATGVRRRRLKGNRNPPKKFPHRKNHKFIDCSFQLLCLFKTANIFLLLAVKFQWITNLLC